MSSPYYTPADDAASAILHGLDPRDGRARWRRQDDERHMRATGLQRPAPCDPSRHRATGPRVVGSIDVVPAGAEAGSTFGASTPDRRALDPAARASALDLLARILAEATPRERAIVRGRLRGLTLREIAAGLDVSEATACTAVHRLAARLRPALA